MDFLNTYLIPTLLFQGTPKTKTNIFLQQGNQKDVEQWLPVEAKRGKETRNSIRWGVKEQGGVGGALSTRIAATSLQPCTYLLGLFI